MVNRSPIQVLWLIPEVWRNIKLMNKTIHPGILFFAGLATFLIGNHVIGGAVGSLIFILGLIMFLSGLAGVIKLVFFSGNIEKRLSDKLDQIYESKLSHDKKVSLSLSAIEKSGLNDEQMHIFVGNIEKAYDISVKH